jgi:hypothetical protein
MNSRQGAHKLLIIRAIIRPHRLELLEPAL